MPTVINNPGTATENSSSAIGVVLAVILVVLLAALLIYGIPAIRSSVNSGTPNVNVPDRIDVNVNGGATPGAGQ